MEDTEGNAPSSFRGAIDDDPVDVGDQKDALDGADAGVDGLAACAADVVPGLDLSPLPTDALAASGPDPLERVW